MPRDLPVREVMTTDVVTFTADMAVRDAMQQLVERSVDAAPVVDGDGRVVGMLSTGDLIVQESELHFPTVIALLGGYIELPSQAKRFDRDISKALGATVSDVMTKEVVSCAPDDTLEHAATLMHDHGVSRLPVTADQRLVGLISRSDVVRAILAATAPDSTE